MRSPDAWLRAATYRLLTWRDGRQDWCRHRQAFLETVGSAGAESPRAVPAGLRRIVEHAYRTVPYYYDAWRAMGFDPSRAFTLEAFGLLPLLRKEDIRTRKPDLVSRAHDVRALDVDYTGGTTGTQTQFYRDRACGVARLGRQWGVLERCGHRVGDRRGVVWGVHAEAGVHRGRSWRGAIRAYGAAHEAICCTSMSAGDMREFHGRLRRFRPRTLYGYPSALAELAEFVRAAGLPPICVARIFCTAERLTDAHRRLLRDVFEGEVFNLYCSREHGCVAFECERHEGLHIDTGSVFVEVVRDGRPVEPGESGEIVITDLLNYGMPFIRHATGDMAAVVAGRCECGLSLPRLARLDGRTTDRLYRPDGRTVTGLMLTDLFADIGQVRVAQFVQTTLDTIDVNVVTDGEIGLPVRARMLREVRDIIGPEIRIRIRPVDDVPRNPRSGKYQEVICRLAEPVASATAPAMNGAEAT